MVCAYQSIASEGRRRSGCFNKCMYLSLRTWYNHKSKKYASFWLFGLAIKQYHKKGILFHFLCNFIPGKYYPKPSRSDFVLPVAHDRKDPGRYGNLRNRGGLLYYHHDALGSVSDLTDHLGENIVKYRWDAFGGRM